MKRILSLVLALSMVLSMFSFAFAGTTLPDVAGTDYEAAVSALVELGIVNGYEDGTYRADKTVTRAEMAKFLVVSAGLEGAADVAKGATNFSDVPATHWATGYINVASQYGYINGYPEGTFAPDATVSYAEAVTMAIRVLGYKTVVEAKGTWPTNYIAKATELKVLEDVSYGRYTDGATRGNVALLMWNMLTTRMWDVESENESNGLNYSKQGTMIEKYFEEYDYIDEDAEFVVTKVDFTEIGKVIIDLESETGLRVDERTVIYKIEDVELAEGVDFLNLFGRTVSLLINEEEEVAVMVIPSNKDKVAEGYVDSLSGDGYKFASGENELIYGGASGEQAYSVNVISSRKNAEYTTYFNGASSVVVKEIKAAKNDFTKVVTVDDKPVAPIDPEAIVLIDGEWATAKDLEAGDILTTLVAGKVYVVSRETVTGSFDEVTAENQVKEDPVFFIKVDGEKYEEVRTAYVIEIDEDGEDIASPYTLDKVHKADDEDEEYKYFGEECTIYLNFLGEVIRIEFEEVEGLEKAGSFYVVTNGEPTWFVTDKTGRTDYIELNEESYEIKKGATITGTIKSGDVVLAKFDSKDRVKELTVVGNTDSVIADDGKDYVFDIVTSGDGNDEILDDYNYVSGDNKYKVTSNTTVYTITGVKDEEVEDLIVGYTVEITKGTEALEGVEEAVVAIESGDTFNKAAYVFVWEAAKNTEKTFGIVEKYTLSNGKTYLTIDGTMYEVDEDQVAIAEALVGALVAFVEDDGIITIALPYRTLELASGDYVVDIDGSIVILHNPASGDTENYAFDLEANEEAFEDYKVFLVTVDQDVDTEEYEFTEYEETTWADVKLKVDDIIAVSADDATVDVILVIRGYDRD